MIRKIGLVTSPRHERGVICRADEQFSPSPVFRRARDYCQRYFDEWYIVSVRRGLLAPGQVIGPGELALLGLAPDERHRWAASIVDALRQRMERSREPVSFVLFSSQRCAELLLRTGQCLSIEVPLNGSGLRERISWYDERLRTESRILPAIKPAVAKLDRALLAIPIR